MLKIMNNGSGAAYGVKHYLADNFEQDKKLLEKNEFSVGSKVYFIDISTWYVLDHNHQWNKIQIANNGTGGGGNPGGGGEGTLPPGIIIRPDGTPNYDGGEI